MNTAEFHANSEIQTLLMEKIAKVDDGLLHESWFESADIGPDNFVAEVSCMNTQGRTVLVRVNVPVSHLGLDESEMEYPVQLNAFVESENDYSQHGYLVPQSVMFGPNFDSTVLAAIKAVESAVIEYWLDTEK